VAAVDVEQRMRHQPYSQKQIAGRAAANAGAALSPEADALVFAGTGGDLYIEGFFPVRQAPAAVVVLRHTEVNPLGRVGHRVLQEQRQIHFGVAAGARARVATVETTAAAEQVLEKFREIRFIAELGVETARVAGAALLLPAGPRFETAALLVAPQLVVLRALVRILERVVGLRYVLEFLLGVVFPGHVGMILARQLAVSGFDRLVVG